MRLENLQYNYKTTLLCLEMSFVLGLSVNFILKGHKSKSVRTTKKHSSYLKFVGPSAKDSSLTSEMLLPYEVSMANLLNI